MQYKLIIEEEMSLLSLKQKIDQGGRFIVFSYCISIFAITLKRLSPAIFIENKEQFHKHKKRYNIINLTLGWWGIPWGLIHTPNFIRSNNKGGADVTNDVLLNISEASLKDRYIEFLRTSMLFDFPEKSDEKIFRKHFEKILKQHAVEINTLAVGLYLNVPDGVEPYYLIGIESVDYFENYIEEIKASLYRDFRKHVRFQFMDISGKDEVVGYLLKQGLVMNK